MTPRKRKPSKRELSARARKGWETRRRKEQERAELETRLEREAIQDESLLLQQAHEDEHEEPRAPRGPEDRYILEEHTLKVFGWQDLYPTGAHAFRGGQARTDEDESESPYNGWVSIYDRLAQAWQRVPKGLQEFAHITLSTDRTGTPVELRPTGELELFMTSIRGLLYTAGIRNTPGSPQLGTASWCRFRVEVTPPPKKRSAEEVRELEARREYHAAHREEINARKRQRHHDPAFNEAYNAKRRARYAKLRELKRRGA